MSRSPQIPKHGSTAAFPAIGLDVGSTTVKAIVMAAGSRALAWSAYRRHEMRQAVVCRDFLNAIEAAFPEIPRHEFRVFVTGSGGSSVADAIGAHFIPETGALCRAAEILHPEARTIIELGGEDAKIITFHKVGPLDSPRKTVSMNDKCAGGTGAVIDRITVKTGLRMDDFRTVNWDKVPIHPVAGKCGVFAETDIIGLQKRGTPPVELMSSLFDSIVLQNLTVLARGEALAPQVLLLGGPHVFMPGLAARWRYHLPRRWREHGLVIPDNEPAGRLIVVPDHALYFGAIGAVFRGQILLSTNPSIGRYRGSEGIQRIMEGRHTAHRHGALVRDDAEREAFTRNYAPPAWSPPPIAPKADVAAYLGIDAGSTSTKAVLMTPQGDILAKSYRLSEGNPVEDLRHVTCELRRDVEKASARLRILGAGVTGYAKEILRHVMQADVAVVETVAHMRAGLCTHPDADVICDIGGQDIKIIFLQHGAVRDFRLNTQCSAGNGFYLQATAAMLGIPVERYADAAFTARHMPDFPYGCAVFLQSGIVDVQRHGWTPGEILAGLAAVLPKNIWLYVCQRHNLTQLGRVFVLQGGVQRNLAAVKAQVDYIRDRFRESGIEPVIRVHEHCGEAGAIGCAMETQQQMEANQRHSTFIGFDALNAVQYHAQHGESTRCGGCVNACLRTFLEIRVNGNKRQAIIAPCANGASGHRQKHTQACDAADESNLAALSARETFRSPDLPLAVPRSGRLGQWIIQQRESLRIGMPRVLSMYAAAPFFLGYFRALGVPEDRLIWSGYSSEKLYREGAKRGCIDPCYPSKLAIAHLHNLIYRIHEKTPLTHLFFPILDTFPTWLRGIVATRACPACTGTVEAATAAFKRDRDVFAERGIQLRKTFVDIGDPHLAARQLWEDWRDDLGMTRRESLRAAEAAFAAWEDFQKLWRKKGRAVLDSLDPCRGLALVMLGRPYHVDPGISHGVWDALHRLGYPILTIESLPIEDEFLHGIFGEDPDALSISDVWRPSFSEYSNRKIWAAKYIARHPRLIGVEWSSFRCGMDAPISSVLEAILRCADKPFFTFRDMDENHSPGSLALRIETLAYGLEQYARRFAGHSLPVLFLDKTQRRADNKAIVEPDHPAQIKGKSDSCLPKSPCSSG